MLFYWIIQYLFGGVLMTLIKLIVTTPLPAMEGLSDEMTEWRSDDDSGVIQEETRYHMSFSSIQVEVNRPSVMEQKIQKSLESKHLAGQTLCEGHVTEHRHYRARVPESLVHANCEASCTNCEQWDRLVYDIPVLMPVEDVEVENGRYTYRRQTESVAVACVCIKPKQHSTTH